MSDCLATGVAFTKPRAVMGIRGDPVDSIRAGCAVVTIKVVPR